MMMKLFLNFSEIEQSTADFLRYKDRQFAAIPTHHTLYGKRISIIALPVGTNNAQMCHVSAISHYLCLIFSRGAPASWRTQTWVRPTTLNFSRTFQHNRLIRGWIIGGPIHFYGPVY